MKTALATDEYEEVKLPRHIAQSGCVMRLSVKRRVPPSDNVVAGPDSSEMLSAVVISLVAVKNTERLAEDFEPDWV